jgi:CHAT domain-containing protein/tetratricopeptide (TPR) repeat protein
MFSVVLSLLLVLAPPDGEGDLERCRALSPPDSDPPVTWAQSATNVESVWTGDAPVSADTVRAALSRVRRARRCFRRLDSTAVSRPYLDDVMRTYYREAAFLAGLRRFDEAFAAFEQGRQALASASSVPQTPGTRAQWARRLHQNQGYLHYLLGDLSASTDHYLAAFRATPHDAVQKRVRHLVDVGILHQRMQDFRAARRYYQRAARLLRRADTDLAPDAPERVLVSVVRADLLLEESTNGDYDRASLRRARTLARRSRRQADPASENYALATLLLAQSQGFLGNVEAGRTLNREVRRRTRAQGNQALLNSALRSLGQLHMQAGHFARADSTLRRALGLARELEDLNAQRRLLELMGRLHELRGEWAAAEQYYRDGVSVVEAYRTSLTASQWSMTAFGEWRDIHRGLVRTLLAQGRERAALTALDRSRARHLQNLRKRARLAEQLPPDQRVRFDSLTRSLTATRNRLGNNAEGARRDSLRTREAALMAARQQVLRIDSVPPRPSIDAISAHLERRDRGLVSYFLDDPLPLHDRAPRSVAFVVTADSLRAVSLPGLTRDSIRTLVAETSPLFRAGETSSRANAMHFDLRPLRALYDAVYAPVREHLPASQPLTVVPDGPLFRVPFSMLVGAAPGGRFAPAQARYVLHERPTALALATSLVADTIRGSPPWSALAPAVAAYGVSDFDTLQTGASSLGAAFRGAGLDSSLRVPPLPGVRTELRTLERTVAGTRVALNDAATERGLRRDIRRAGVLHVASHALVNPTAPLQNALLLHPDSDSAASDADGVLFLHELRGRARIPLVVLSGCNTARGPLRGGEGMEGLQYAFRALGAQSTLSTLWSVADNASVDLMTAFYEHLRSGVSKDRALRRAQLDYLAAHPDRASPFFWAAPVLYGAAAPVPLESPALLPFGGPWLWGGLAVLGALALALALLWRGRDRLPEPFCHLGRPA